MIRYYCDKCNNEMIKYKGHTLVVPEKIVPTGYSSFLNNKEILNRKSMTILLCNTCFDELAMLMVKNNFIDNYWLKEYNESLAFNMEKNGDINV